VFLLSPPCPGKGALPGCLRCSAVGSWVSCSDFSISAGCAPRWFPLGFSQWLPRGRCTPGCARPLHTRSVRLAYIPVLTPPPAHFVLPGTVLVCAACGCDLGDLHLKSPAWDLGALGGCSVRGDTKGHLLHQPLHGCGTSPPLEPRRLNVGVQTPEVSSAVMEAQLLHLNPHRELIKLRDLGKVVHACNPSCSGGRDQEDQGSKPARTDSSQDQPITKKDWWNGSRCRP
jgi:hypothetical protein